MGASRGRRARAGLAATGLALALATARVAANAPGDPSTDPALARLANMSLEELMNTEVVSVAGRPSARISTPAALTVITAEDIRRAGHRNVAEALRMVPGMYVARLNAASWVVGSRGLTGSVLTATRYLVLIDGRLVYDPLLSSTFWDTADVPLADIDRIEVVRGPGATLWGVNAMNGVVNIITRRAEDTLGALVQAGAGTNSNEDLYLRYGATSTEGTAWRIWTQYGHHGGFEDADGNELRDTWSRVRGGFRADGALQSGTGWTLQGDAYFHPTAMESALIPRPDAHLQSDRQTADNSINGANLLFRLTSGFDQDRGWMLRAYYDHTRREALRFDVRRDTVDVEYRRWLAWGGRNTLIWGLQYDRTSDQVENTPSVVFDPAERAWNTSNVFVQNTTALVPEKLFLMLGTKLTEHSFVGFQVQPSARLWWTPDARRTWWASVSRPVRVPSRFEEDGFLVFSFADRGQLATGTPDGVYVPLGLAGNGALKAEQLMAWETGYRFQLGDRWMIDTSLFYNDYQRLIGVPPTIFGDFTDAATGATWGGEMSISAQITPQWKVEGSYSRLHTRIDGPVLPYEETGTPEQLAQLRSYFDISPDLELNAALYRVGEAPFNGIPAYTRGDLGMTWRPRPGLELSAWGQNLLDASHREASGAEVPRGVYLQMAFALEP